jgi:hypothetical protein
MPREPLANCRSLPGQKAPWVLLERFQLMDPALAALREIVHCIDLKDGKFGRPESPSSRTWTPMCASGRSPVEPMRAAV